MKVMHTPPVVQASNARLPVLCLLPMRVQKKATATA